VIKFATIREVSYNVRKDAMSIDSIGCLFLVIQANTCPGNGFGQLSRYGKRVCCVQFAEHEFWLRPDAGSITNSRGLNYPDLVDGPTNGQGQLQLYN
jgi:hypothetical protein